MKILIDIFKMTISEVSISYIINTGIFFRSSDENIIRKMLNYKK